MSKIETEQKIDNLLDVYTKTDEDNQARLLKERNKEIEAFLPRKNNNEDATDGIFDFLKDLLDYVQEEFDELLGGDSDKKDLSGSVKDLWLVIKYKSRHS